jgi:hypothetical protein
MNRKMSFGLIVLLLGVPILAQKKAAELPKVFTTSQFVFVETVYGPVNDTTVDPRITPEDRAAVSRIEDALRTWGRYQLAFKRSEADLVLVVRKGQLAEAHAGVNVSRRRQPPGGLSQTGTNVGPVVGGEVGSPYDLLTVYIKNQDGSLGGPFWRRAQDHGLDEPDLLLFKKFKEAVEASSKAPAKKTP